MNIIKLQNGDLEISADCNEQREFKRYLKIAAKDGTTMIALEAGIIGDYFTDFEQVRPEDVGALTDAPLISDGDTVYGFMDYQVKNFLDELAAGHSTTWNKG